MPKLPESLMGAIILLQEYESALKQIGTLGGGNHFIEIQKGSDGYIWIMVHSGSRNLGYKVARYYNDIAKKYFPKVTKLSSSKTKSKTRAAKSHFVAKSNAAKHGRPT